MAMMAMMAMMAVVIPATMRLPTSDPASRCSASLY
jgi:hypothetical protein